MKRQLASLLTATMFAACGGAPATTDTPIPESTNLTPEAARAAAKEAFIFGLPMVLNYKTLYEYTLNKESSQYKGPFNQPLCEARLFTPDDTTIVTPNSDTPYCMGWLDLSSGPLVYSVPAMESDRFYHIQFTDWYTHNYDYVGTRTDQNKAGKYLVVGPNWEGEKPEGFERVIKSETNLVITVTRTQLKNKADLPRVKEIQDQFVVTPLEGAPPSELASKLSAPPAWQDGAEQTPEVFNYLDFALDFVKPNPEDKAAWDAFATLGLGTPEAFDINAIDPAIAAAMGEGVKDGLAEIQGFLKTESSDPILSAKIYGTRAFLGKTDVAGGASRDLKRAMAAFVGLYGNSGEEAVYPAYFVDAAGQSLDASGTNYTFTFKAGSLPPAEAFWSLSMYDGKTQLFIKNPVDRYLLKSADVDTFKKNKDGSITLVIQKDAPAKDLMANWLPAPNGPFYMVLRVYQPKPEMLEGKWTPPEAIPAQ